MLDSDAASNGSSRADSHYRALFDGAPVAILIVDTDSLKIIDANAEAAEMFCYTRDELRRLSVTELSMEPAETQRVISDETPFVPTRRFRRKDGTSFLGEVSASKTLFDDSSARVSYIRDITMRLKDQAELRASEAKYAAAFSSSPDAVNINRLEDGVYVEINEGFTALTGYTTEDVVGRSSLELGVWRDAAGRQQLVEGLLSSGHIDELEAEFVGKDGAIHPSLMSARVLDIEGVPHILSVTRDITERKQAEGELSASNARLAEMVLEITKALGRVVEIRDPYTHGHQERVARVSRAIATEMGLSALDVEAVEMSALVHDVGKLAVPAEILNRPGVLSDVEFGLIKAHSERGFEILKGVHFPWPMAQIVLQHHERQDGSGYPAGLRGDEILPAARILAIADVVEAMASYRPYRPALGLAAAVAEIERFPGKYDAQAREACLTLYARGELAFLDS